MNITVNYLVINDYHYNIVSQINKYTLHEGRLKFDLKFKCTTTLIKLNCFGITFHN